MFVIDWLIILLLMIVIRTQNNYNSDTNKKILFIFMFFLKMYLKNYENNQYIKLMIGNPHIAIDHDSAQFGNDAIGYNTIGYNAGYVAKYDNPTSFWKILEEEGIKLFDSLISTMPTLFALGGHKNIKKSLLTMFSPNLVRIFFKFSMHFIQKQKMSVNFLKKTDTFRVLISVNTNVYTNIFRDIVIQCNSEYVGKKYMCRYSESMQSIIPLNSEFGEEGMCYVCKKYKDDIFIRFVSVPYGTPDVYSSNLNERLTPCIIECKNKETILSYIKDMELYKKECSLGKIFYATSSEHDTNQQHEEEEKKKKDSKKQENVHIIVDSTKNKKYSFCWEERKIQFRKSMEGLILDEDVQHILDKNIDTFLRLKRLGKKYSVPVKRSIMLYGPPGTGKTATGYAVSEKLGFHLYYIDRSELKAPEALPYLLDSVPEGSVVMFDDSDLLMEELKRSKTDIFSSFIHRLDGYTNFNNCFILFTTNSRLEDIDPALTRAGRIDDKILYSNMTLHQLHLFLKLLDNNIYSPDDIPNEPLKIISPAEFLMNYILPYCEDYPLLLEKIKKDLFMS